MQKNDSLDTTMICDYNTVYMKVLKNGKLFSKTEFQHEVDTEFYDNGKPEIVREGPWWDFDCKYKTFYRNGKLKSESQQGIACAMGIQVGEQLDYDSLGNLLDKISFNNICDTIYNSGHNTWTIATTIEYYPGNKMKAKKMNTSGYESGGDCPCGTWEYYDKNGNLVKKEKYPDCKDGNLDCLDK